MNKQDIDFCKRKIIEIVKSFDSEEPLRFIFHMCIGVQNAEEKKKGSH